MQQQFKFELVFFYYYKAARDKDISILVTVILLNTRSDIGHNFETELHK